MRCRLGVRDGTDPVPVDTVAARTVGERPGAARARTVAGPARTVGEVPPRPVDPFPRCRVRPREVGLSDVRRQAPEVELGNRSEGTGEAVAVGSPPSGVPERPLRRDRRVRSAQLTPPPRRPAGRRATAAGRRATARGHAGSVPPAGWRSPGSAWSRRPAANGPRVVSSGGSTIGPVLSSRSAVDRPVHRVAPVRRARVAGPAGMVVRSPKNSTSMPVPSMSRSHRSPTSPPARRVASRVPPSAGRAGRW